MLGLLMMLFAAQAPAGDLYDRVLEYRREHLEVRPLARAVWITPLALSVDGAYYLDSNPGWNSAFPRMTSLPDVGGDWGIVRGAAEVLDDRDLAKLLHDDGLLQAVEAERFWPRVFWSAGFGALSAASLGTGSYLTWRHYDGDDSRRNGQAVGISLLTVGAATALLAVLFPTYADHVMSPHDAAVRCDAYNAELRERLLLDPEDLRRF